MITRTWRFIQFHEFYFWWNFLVQKVNNWKMLINSCRYVHKILISRQRLSMCDNGVHAFQTWLRTHMQHQINLEQIKSTININRHSLMFVCASLPKQPLLNLYNWITGSLSYSKVASLYARTYKIVWENFIYLYFYAYVHPQRGMPTLFVGKNREFEIITEYVMMEIVN